MLHTLLTSLVSRGAAVADGIDDLVAGLLIPPRPRLVLLRAWTTGSV
ncbi:MAG: hypothetical protein ABF379_07195 [Akkermansiaceae bacterium]